MRDPIIVFRDRLVGHGLLEELNTPLKGVEVKAVIEEEEVKAIVGEAEVKVDEGVKAIIEEELRAIEAEVKVDEEAKEVVVTEAKVNIDHPVEAEEIEEHILDRLGKKQFGEEQEVNLWFLILLIKDEKMIELLFNLEDADRDQRHITVGIVEESHVPAVVLKKKLYMFQYISQLLLLCRTHKK